MRFAAIAVIATRECNEVSRVALHEMVWSKPMTAIARQFGAIEGVEVFIRRSSITGSTAPFQGTE